ncbi:MAG: response regulator [Campylobacterota bacterium]|nr:response regulator [Campylobacterota bacterium]
MNNNLIYLLSLVITVNLLATVDTNLVDLKNIPTDSEDFTVWAALFGLGAVALISLFISSEQMKNFKLGIKKKEDNQNNIIQAQDQLLSNMSEDIQNIAQNTVKTTKELADNDTDLETHINRVIHSENQLLDIATNLIEYLRIKSKKITSANEPFKLSNLLNDVSGTLKSNTDKIELELIYDVKNNISENLYGDTLNLSKILVNILLYCVNDNAKELTVDISKNNFFSKSEELFFVIKSDIKINVENSKNIFHSNYNEETNSYDSLGLFIAKELSVLMGGELIARNDDRGLIEFVFNIPYKEVKQQEESNSLIESKSIFLVDSSDSSAAVIKNIFSALKHKVHLESKEKFLQNKPNFSTYDLVIIDEKLFRDDVLKALKISNAKIISLSNLFKKSKKYPNAKIAEIQLSKPSTHKQIKQAMQKIYLKEPTKIDEAQDAKIEKNSLLVYRRTFDDTPDVNLSRFSEFRGSKVLLVEDNLINQKVLLGILSKSGMKITVANHGKEALDILSTDEEFDIVFMDINMPIMDGYTAAKKIRDNPKFNKLPIVALTALTSASEIDKMFNCKMNGYLAKPLKKEKLFSVLTIFVEKRFQDRRTNQREEKTINTLDGLNVHLGITQSNADEIFYTEILSEFKYAYGDSDTTFAKLVKDFRYEQLRMLCIDLKGLSGSIGAEDMHQLTTEILQRLIYKKYELIPTYIDQYAKELHRINRSIDQYIAA